MMRRQGVYLLMFVLLLTGCVLPNFDGRNWDYTPSRGATMEDVRKQWGSPSYTSWADNGRHDVELWTYERSHIVVMPGSGYGPSRFRDYRHYTVTFIDGKVTGLSY